MSAVNIFFKAAFTGWDQDEEGGTSSFAEFILMVVIKKIMQMREAEFAFDFVPFTPSLSELSGKEIVLYYAANYWLEEDLSNLSENEIKERMGEMFSLLEVIGKKGRQLFDEGFDPSDSTD